MRILAIDTALSAASACVYEEGAESPLSADTMAMERGHAEALMPLIDRVIAHAGGGFAALDRIAVTIGPGSFTGLRVGIAAARALGVACKVPVTGVSTLTALAAPVIIEQKPGLVAVAIDARNGEVYFAAFAPDGRCVSAPRALPAKEALRSLGSGPVRIVGSGAAIVAAEAAATGTEVEVIRPFPGLDVLWVAKLGLLADPDHAPPRPLYLKAPSASVAQVAPPPAPP